MYTVPIGGSMGGAGDPDDDEQQKDRRGGGHRPLKDLAGDAIEDAP